MSRNDIANLAFKITGLYCLIQGIPFVRWALDARAWASTVWDYESWIVTLAMVVPLGLTMALGFYLLKQSRRLSEKMFPSPAPDPVPTDAGSVQAMAFSVVGLFAVVSALPNLVGALLGIWLRWGDVQAKLGFYDEAAFVIPWLLQLALGVTLFVGAQRLAWFWRRLRLTGLAGKLDVCPSCGRSPIDATPTVCRTCGASTLAEDEIAKE